MSSFPPQHFTIGISRYTTAWQKSDHFAADNQLLCVGAVLSANHFLRTVVVLPVVLLLELGLGVLLVTVAVFV